MTLEVSASLDSSLKKNTAFIKRSRMALNAENVPIFAKDVVTLSLEKYMSEVVSAFAEGLAKVKTADVSAAVETVELLHRRFSRPFTIQLAFQLVRGLAPPPQSYLNSLSAEQREKEESTRVTRQRTLLRVVTELWLVGVFRTIQDALDGANAEPRKRKMDEPLPLFCLRELLANDKDFVNLSIVVSFVKAFGHLTQSDVSEEIILSHDTASMCTILLKYFELLKSHTLARHDRLIREAARIQEHVIAQGQASSRREQALLEQQRIQEKQVAGAQTLAEVLHQDFPTLQTLEEQLAEEASMIRGFGVDRRGDEGDDYLGLWEDDDQRRFYRELVDLKEVVPGDLLNDDKEPRKDVEPEKEDFDDMDPIEEEEDEPQPATIGAKLDTLLLRLPELNNRELIDQACIDFSFLNTKASRNRLVKMLLQVSKTRTDILSYYARLVATLSKHLPSIAQKMVESLHRDLRRYVNGKGLNKDYPLRAINALFLAELIKFDLVSAPVTFHCLKLLVENFSKTDIEVLASMLENCGRYLLRSDATHTRMAAFLEVLHRKSKNASGVERSLIDNAFYYVNPPEREVIPVKQREPMERYIRQLVYVDLSRRTYEMVTKQIRKLPWQGDGPGWLQNIFVKVWKVKYSAIPLLAIVLGGLAKYHPGFTTHVIDAVLEEMRVGLEENNFRHHQKRIALAKYLGELYNHRLVDGQVVMEQLQLLLTLGHGPRPLPVECAIDPRNDHFRVRLACILLDTCASAFQRPPLLAKRNLSLALLQSYIFCKAPLPLEIEFGVLDTFAAVDKNWHMAETLEEANAKLDEAAKAAAMIVDVEDSSDESETSPQAHFQSDDEEEIQNLQLDEDDGEQVVLLQKRKEQDDLDKEAEADFAREFSKMMTESIDARKHETRRPLEVAMPMRRIQPMQETPTSGQVQFSFLSRKGKTRDLQLPADNKLVLSAQASRKAELAEQATIKQLVISYEDNYTEDDEAAGVLQTPLRAGQKSVRGAKTHASRRTSKLGDHLHQLESV
ncbi:armadillo-type protein [Protomyces lactucae-debilis]|uniref:Armadillo-type protein n=1 Tax=Protomyces lactucae-debilis TaxID=2754530 RepID=A0A1Y2FE58_PROLT|nr:armadillo-type protein [Protomyces lactucae-debilis]ORY81907.1 armadillo-type protein [Protomyces lactucae-debilis]